MRKVLIVNLTRFGDLLQTSPTIAGLRAAGDTEVTVVVERNFADVCEGIPGVDRVWPIDLDALGRLLLADDLRAAYHAVAHELAALRAERFALALNYSSSRMSAVLLRLIGVPDTRGWSMSGDGHRLITHPWSRLFSASCLTRRQAAFNLVDHYQRVAGISAGTRRLCFEVPPAARSRVAVLLADGGVGPDQPLVAMQLGASRDIRRWPARHFVAVGRLLHAQLGVRLVLCGGGGDRPMAGEIVAALGPAAVDCCGRTSIAELGALLERADVLLTGDTGPMHMAVAVGTPVVALFFGPALPVDTGPYAADQLCLHAPVACAPCDHAITCLNPFCRDVLEPEAVTAAVIARRAQDWQGLEAAARRWPRIAWYRTGFDAEGLFDLAPLGGAPPSPAERLRRAHRALWKGELDGTPPRPVDGPPLAAEGEALRALAGLARHAAAQATRVERLAGGDADVEVLEAAGRELEVLDAAIFRHGAIHEAAAQLVQLHRFEKENVLGDDVAALARATRAQHEALARRARRLADLVAPRAAATATVEAGGIHAGVA